MEKNKLIRHELGYYEIANKPSAKELQDYYHNKYYQDETANYRKSYSNDELKYLRFKIIQKKFLIDRIINNNSGTLLDIGCGEGHTLKFFDENGWVVRGIDFSEQGLKQINPEMLSYAEIGNMDNIITEEISAGNLYDVVNLKNVLEHVRNPIRLLKNIRKLVKNSGCLVVTVPNDFSDLQKYCYKNDYIDEKFGLEKKMHWFSVKGNEEFSNPNNIINKVKRKFR